MGLATLLGRFRGPVIADVQVDVSVRETHRSQADLSEHAIELGSDLADHRKVKPDELSLEGVISDAPTTLVDRLTATSADERYLQLLDAFNNAEPFEVITGLRVYEDMHFTSFEVVRTKDTGAIIGFNANMRQLEFADSETVQVETSEPKAQPTADVGPKATKPATEAATKSMQSTANKIGKLGLFQKLRSVTGVAGG